MYVHIDPEILRRYPWIAVLIGGAGMVLFFFLCRAMLNEYNRYKVQGKPEKVTIQSLRAIEKNRWVTLVDGHWNCNLTFYEERRLPEKWIFGTVHNTQIPIQDSTGNILVVAKYDGEVRCEDVKDLPLTGILASQKDQVWGSRIAPQIQTLPSNVILVLHVSAGPQKARNYFWGGFAFLIVFTIFTMVYLHLWSKSTVDNTH